MQGTRLAALIAIVALLALTMVVVVVVDPVGPQLEPGGSLPPDASSAPDIGGRDALIAEPVAEGRGPSFDVRAHRGYPTSDVAQSKLWFHEGSWWGALLAERTNEYRIHRLDWVNQRWVDTGTIIGDRHGTLPDAVVFGDQVVIATGGLDPRGRRGAAVLRYTYAPETETYQLDPDFPVTLTTDPATSLTIARGEEGRLWAAYVSAGQLFVSRTDGNDHVWREPVTPDAPGEDLDEDAASLFAFDDTVGLIWSHVLDDRVTFATPVVVEDGPDEWTRHQVVVEGLRYADDHVNVAVLPGDDGDRVFVAIKTSLDERDNANRLDPQVLLLVRQPDGTWRQHLVARVDERWSRPIVLLDPDNRVVYVAANAPFGGGGIYLKASPIDRISFPAGLGTPLIEKEDAPQVSSVTSTKQLVDPGMGLVFLASDSLTGEYHHVALLPSGGGTEIARAPFEYPAPAARRLLDDRFDPFAAGSPLGNGWAVRANGETTFAILDTDDGRRVAGTISTADGSRARACKEIHPVADGLLRVETVVLQSAVGDSDTVTAAVRHQGGISAAVHLSRRGVFSYVEGGTIVRTELPYAANTWYRVILTLDLTARTYDWEVQRAADDAPVIGAQGVGLSPAASIPADEVCVQSSNAPGAGLQFLVDSVLVEQR
jgi:hypothetical protein